MSIQNNIESLQSVLAMVNGLPSGGSSGGSDTQTGSLQSKTVTPTKSSQTVRPDSGYDGLSQVTVNAIPSTYVQVQRKTGTFTTSSASVPSATVNCGFQPDFVLIHISSHNDYEWNMGFTRSEKFTNLSTCACEAQLEEGVVDGFLIFNSSGFQIYLNSCDWSWGDLPSLVSRKTFNYTAVKYT